MKFVIDNIFLIAVAFISGAMLIWPLVKRGGGPTVSTLEATQMINRQDALVLDVRDQAEYSKGHVLNARNIPLAQIEARIADLGKQKDKPVIVYCASGNSSGAAIATLLKGGFASAVSLNGGFSAWQQAGLPVEK